MLSKDLQGLYEAYKNVYEQNDLITDALIEEVVEELVLEFIEEGYTLDEAVEIVEESALEYFDEATVTYGSDTESPEQRRERAKKKVGEKKSAARKAAVTGAVERVKTTVSGVRAAAGIAGSIAKDEARRAGRSVQHKAEKAAQAVKDAPGKAKEAVKSGIRKLVGRGLRKVEKGAGYLAQKARKAGSAVGKAAERLGESSSVDEGLLDIGREVAGNVGSAIGRNRGQKTGIPGAGGVGEVIGRNRGTSTFDNVTKPVRDMNIPGFNKGGTVKKLYNSYEPEGEMVDENVGGSVKMKPGSGLGGGTPVYPKGQEPKATGAKLPTLQNAGYELEGESLRESGLFSEEEIAAILEASERIDEAQKPLPTQKMKNRRFYVYHKTGEAAGSSRNTKIAQVLDAHKNDPEGEAAKAKAKSKYKG